MLELVCPHCNEIFADHHLLSEHVKTCFARPSITPNSYRCTYCGKDFEFKTVLEYHVHMSCEKSPHTKTEKVGKLSSSKCPQFHLIPFSTLLTLAGIFELGEEKHKEAAWNATHPDRLTEEWVIVRLEHVIKHAFIALRKLHNLEPFDGIDDAGAILFGGSVLAEWNSINKKTE